MYSENNMYTVQFFLLLFTIFNNSHKNDIDQYLNQQQSGFSVYDIYIGMGVKPQLSVTRGGGYAPHMIFITKYKSIQRCFNPKRINPFRMFDYKLLLCIYDMQHKICLSHNPPGNFFLAIFFYFEPLLQSCDQLELAGICCRRQGVEHTLQKMEGIGLT